MSTLDDGSETFDPARRRLCPDGSCIGVLDDAGRCSVCGRAGDGSAPAAAAVTPDDAPAAALVADEVPAPFDPGRKLCPDGACVGVLGPDGRCKVCGRAGAEGA